MATKSSCDISRSQKYKQECLTELNDENAIVYFETNKYLIITHN